VGFTIAHKEDFNPYTVLYKGKGNGGMGNAKTRNKKWQIRSKGTNGRLQRRNKKCQQLIT